MKQINYTFVRKLMFLFIMLSLSQLSFAGAIEYKSLYVYAETYPTGIGTVYLQVADGGAVTETDTDQTSYSSTEPGTSFDLRFTGATGYPGLACNIKVDNIPEGKYLWGYYKSDTPMTPEQLDALTVEDLMANQNPVDIDANNVNHPVDYSSDEEVAEGIRYNEQYTFNATWGDDEWRADHSTPDTYIYAIIKDPYPVNVAYYRGEGYDEEYLDAQDGSVEGTIPFGTFTMTPENAMAGDEITLTAKAAPGFEFAYWTNNANEKELNLEVLSQNSEFTTEASSSTYVPVFRLAPVEINDEVGWSTYSVASKINFYESDSRYSLKAFAVVAKKDNTLYLRQMKMTEPGYGLLCNADGGYYSVNNEGFVADNYAFMDFEEDPDLDMVLKKNLLQGTAYAPFTVPEDSYNYYVLADKSQGVGFYLVAPGVVIPQNKAYLKFANNSSAKTFYGIDFGTTGIEGVSSEDNDRGDIKLYNTSGQKVDDSYKGIIISNGRKYNNK